MSNIDDHLLDRSRTFKVRITKDQAALLIDRMDGPLDWTDAGHGAPLRAILVETRDSPLRFPAAGDRLHLNDEEAEALHQLLRPHVTDCEHDQRTRQMMDRIRAKTARVWRIREKENERKFDLAIAQASAYLRNKYGQQ